MRALQFSGLVLIAIGLWVIIRPPGYSRDETVLKFGDIEAKVQQQRTLPEWAGARYGNRDRPNGAQEDLIPNTGLGDPLMMTRVERPILSSRFSVFQRVKWPNLGKILDTLEKNF